MRVAAVAAVAVIAVACIDLPEVDATAAARADSSAAGYHVGADTRVPAPRDTSPAPAARARAAAPRVAEPPQIARAEPDTAPSSVPAPAVDFDTLPDTVALGVVGQWMPRARAVRLDLIAAQGEENRGLNFNGGAHGGQTLTVPEGWLVELRVGNADPDLAHSVIILEQSDRIPAVPAAPAFFGAALPQIEEGILEGSVELLRFVAERSGRYRIACGIPGHAQSGMWLSLVVSPDARVPRYER